MWGGGYPGYATAGGGRGDLTAATALLATAANKLLCVCVYVCVFVMTPWCNLIISNLKRVKIQNSRINGCYNLNTTVLLTIKHQMRLRSIAMVLSRFEQIKRR